MNIHVRNTLLDQTPPRQYGQTTQKSLEATETASGFMPKEHISLLYSLNPGSQSIKGGFTISLKSPFNLLLLRVYVNVWVCLVHTHTCTRMHMRLSPLP